MGRNGHECDTFNECDTFYIWNFALLKNSGKIKGEIKAAAQALNIKHYTLPKLTSTHFVGHHCNTYTRLLNLWPAITMAYENVCADENTKPDTKVKVTGYLAKLRSYSFLCLLCLYVHILEIVTPISEVFKSKALMPNEVKPLLSETVTSIDDFLEGEHDNKMLVSHLASFRIVEGELTLAFIKADDPHKQNVGKECITYKFHNMISLEDGVLIRAIEEKKGILKDLKAILISKFTDFSSPIFANMNWVDPKN